jgi:nicotinamide mononucleotide (NMN) deamidase PncC
MWHDKLKELGVNIHVVATGAGAGFQDELWEIPGSSAYLSGASFPYSAEEQEELLGFMPEHFCSEEASVDLACAAYMKAYKFGGKRPVGIGLTASVASEKIHRGEHRVYATIVTDDKVLTIHQDFEKGVGHVQRAADGSSCNDLAFFLMLDTLGIGSFLRDEIAQKYKDNIELAKTRFMARPFFTANGKRLEKLPKGGRYALMPGAFNPPHEGHFGAAEAAMTDYNYRAVFEVTANPPHKDALKVQELLQRAKLLQGQDRLFTQDLPYYLDKARKYSKRPFILGADAMVRMLDPKWGIDINDMFNAFYDLSTKLFVINREIDGHMTTCEHILNDIKANHPFKIWATAQVVMKPLNGEWNISSTELRNKKL